MLHFNEGLSSIYGYLATAFTRGVLEEVTLYCMYYIVYISRSRWKARKING
jgi:hypothetical protein